VGKIKLKSSQESRVGKVGRSPKNLCSIAGQGFLIPFTMALSQPQPINIAGTHEDAVAKKR